MFKILLLLLLPLLSISSYATESITNEIKVYRSSTCHCCHKWIEHLEQNKFNVIDLFSHDMNSVKEAMKLPKQMRSCHTAIIGGYIIEGHVPAEDIRRLLVDKPDISGLSVPQMPIGTPGMEMGERKDPFIVFQFTQQGKYSVFNQYDLDENNHYQSHGNQH